MKNTVKILLLALALSPAVIFAQIGGAVTPPPAVQPAETVPAPFVIGTGVDIGNTSNQVYIIWSEPIKKTISTNPVDGLTIFINNVQRPVVNNGGEVGSLSVETFVTPIGIEIQPTDTVRVSYSPGTNPIIGRDTSKRGQTLSVTDVTNGLAGDTTCPLFQNRLIRVNSNKLIFQGYFNERINRGETSFQDYGADGNIKVGTTPVASAITLSLGSNVATKVIGQTGLNWSQQLSITIDATTTLSDTAGNKACIGTFTPSLTAASNTTQPIATSTQISTLPTTPTNTPQATELPAPIQSAVTPETPAVTALASTAGLPMIQSVTVSEPSGSYKPGTKLKFLATASTALDSSSALIIELSTAGKKVLLRPVSDGSMILQGNLAITANMISTTPLRITKIVTMKLFDNANTKKVNTATTALWLDPANPEYKNNLGDKDITVEN